MCNPLCDSPSPLFTFTFFPYNTLPGISKDCQELHAARNLSVRQKVRIRKGESLCTIFEYNQDKEVSLLGYPVKQQGVFESQVLGAISS